MSLTIGATYENGVLKPDQPLPLKEHEKVLLTIEPAAGRVQAAAGVIGCTEPRLIEWAATDPELDFPPPPEQP
jgi:predicted DNA-binding antitoxin AbrB/MazE fold protein